MLKKLKSIAKRSRLINGTYTGLHNWYRFFSITSVKDIVNFFKDLGKLKLYLTVKPYTMVAFPRLSTLNRLASRLEKEGVKGNFIECGVRNGGTAGVIAAAAKRDSGRHIWLFDSWEGFPEPDERDFSVMQEEAKKGEDLGSEERVRELLFKRLNVDSSRVHLVKGWFSDTLREKEIGDVALVHLDCDLYESVKFCLENLYDRVVEGGYIVIDDYGYWKGCKQAVDEFIEHRNLNVQMVRVDSQGVYFRKESVNSSK